MQQIITLPTITDGFATLGVSAGSTLMVHCSMSSFGRIHGGAQTIVEALTKTVGDSGTIVMPTLTNGRFDPSEWGNPSAPEEHWDRIRFETPAFHPQKTPCDHTMSAVYELFRTWPDASRTNHPHSSVAAWGRHRDRIVSVHKLEERFGNSSPLGVLYELDAQVLFLGTTYSTNTCFHLAEYRRPNPPVREFFIVQGLDQNKRLTTYTDVDTNSSIFEAIGEDFERERDVRIEVIGSAPCRLFGFRAAVDYAEEWLTNRGG
ncbi:MAG: aminoglycoside N(3)-acetyltransferase [bacterium]